MPRTRDTKSAEDILRDKFHRLICDMAEKA